LLYYEDNIIKLAEDCLISNLSNIFVFQGFNVKVGSISHTEILQANR